MKHILTLAALVYATCCFGQVPLDVPTNDLISWYGFDGNTDDAHTWLAHCEAHSPSFVLDRFGLESRAIDFDGVEDEMVVPDLGQYTDLNELTVSMWVKFGAYPDYSSEDGGHALFMKMQPVGANAVVQFSIYTEYDHNALRFDTRFANGTQINLRFEPFSESLDTGSWHHLTCRFDGTKNQIFWEGALVAESDTYPQMSILNTSYDVMTSTAFGNTDRWQGSLDDLGTWSRALSMAEIQSLYSWAPPSGCTNPEACNFKPDAVIDDGTCASCEALATACGEGTIWDAVTSTCIVANVSDTDFDGCVGINDFLIHLSNFGSGCGPESAWSCGDQLEYQGYGYETVQIGEQCWFAENLRAESYQNGDSITSGLSNEEWSSATTGATAVYGHDNSYLDAYGRLYNFHVVEDNRSICPAMWHVPSDDEVIELENQLGMMPGEATAVGFRGGNIGDALKSTSGWNGDGNGTNVSGMNVVPSGNRYHHGAFLSLGENGSWWTSTQNQNDESKAWYRSLSHDDEGIYREQDALKTIGFPIRCIKDSE